MDHYSKRYYDKMIAPKEIGTDARTDHSENEDADEDGGEEDIPTFCHGVFEKAQVGPFIY